MIKYRYGGKTGKQFNLATSDELVVVRTHGNEPVTGDAAFEAAPLSVEARELLRSFEPVMRVGEVGVSVLRSRVSRGARSLRDKTRAVLKEEPAVQFAGRVLCDPRSGRPVLYTENLFVKFEDDEAVSRCRRLLKEQGLEIKREIEYARNAFFVGAPEGAGQETFALAERLLKERTVELCHPELIREMRQRSVFPSQWHLKKMSIGGQSIDAHVNIESAWAATEGAGVIIAVIDDGADLDHEEFRSSGKIVAPRDVTRRSDNPRPGNDDNHGTACAGVACADGNFGASGVAPRARLMPIRLASGLGSQAEADAFIWAAQNGADVISCSWGPPDGEWWNPQDPTHNQVVPLPDSSRLAIDWAVSNGRNGKGCVILWASGNGNESVDNDGYASYEKVIAVAACNDSSQRSVYSDFGSAILCAFPSNDFAPGSTKTPGIWTTDRTGVVGYNRGQTTRGDAAGNYTNSFGGTSSATPGAAGVAALVLSRNPNLRWNEVRDILRRSCVRIDTANGNYDADGHSAWYGYGRLDAKAAVDLAVPAQPDRVVTVTTAKDVPILDLKKSKLEFNACETAPLKSVALGIDLEHTYVGDLVVTVEPPSQMGLAPLTLHNREGGGAANLKLSYDTVNAPALSALIGKNPQGAWTLVVEDKAKADTGTIRSVSLTMSV